MPKFKSKGEKGPVQSVALSTGKASSTFGQSGQLPYRAKAAKSLVRKGR